MSTTIRPEISKSKAYWISKHRYYELKHFCLQYNEFKKARAFLMLDVEPGRSKLDEAYAKCLYSSDPTGDISVKLASLDAKIDMIRDSAIKTDAELSEYILEAVTKGYSYDILRARENIPCGKDLFYNRYRRFFWTLSRIRD